MKLYQYNPHLRQLVQTTNKHFHSPNYKHKKAFQSMSHKEIDEFMKENMK